MNEVDIIVEGPSERTFIQNVLSPYLAEQGCYANAWVIGVAGHKGGNVTFDRFSHDIGIALYQRSETRISSMLDYFRLDSNWPGMDEIRRTLQSGRTLGKHEIEAILNTNTKHDIEALFPQSHVSNRFIPYFSMHEFEALLFSDVSKLSQTIQVPEQVFKTILMQYEGDPEQINTDPSKAPSKQIIKHYPQYRKVTQGEIIAESIGLPKIRTKCSCFDYWVTSLLQ